MIDAKPIERRAVLLSFFPRRAPARPSRAARAWVVGPRATRASQRRGGSRILELGQDVRLARDPEQALALRDAREQREPWDQ